MNDYADEIDPDDWVGAVYERHRQGLFTLALSITRAVETAEDAIHEAFLRLWRTGRRPEGDPTAYIFTAVRNAAIDTIRRKREYASDDGLFDAVTPQDDDPSERLHHAETSEAVQSALATLPEAQQEAIVMRIWGGLTFDQMATVVGAPLPTVAARYRRGLAKLKDLLEKKVQA